MDQLEADVQGLREAIIEASPSNMHLHTQKGEHLKAIVEDFTKVYCIKL